MKAEELHLASNGMGQFALDAQVAVVAAAGPTTAPAPTKGLCFDWPKPGGCYRGNTCKFEHPGQPGSKRGLESEPGRRAQRQKPSQKSSSRFHCVFCGTDAGHITRSCPHADPKLMKAREDATAQIRANMPARNEK